MRGDHVIHYHGGTWLFQTEQSVGNFIYLLGAFCRKLENSAGLGSLYFIDWKYIILNLPIIFGIRFRFLLFIRSVFFSFSAKIISNLLFCPILLGNVRALRRFKIRSILWQRQLVVAVKMEISPRKLCQKSSHLLVPTIL